MPVLVLVARLFQDRDIGLREAAVAIGGAGFDRQLDQNAVRPEDRCEYFHEFPNAGRVGRVLSHFVDQVSVDELVSLAGEEAGVHHVLHVRSCDLPLSR